MGDTASPPDDGAPRNVSTASVTTARGITADVRVYDSGPTGAASIPVVFFHGATGLFDHEPMLEALSARYQIYAPALPGFGPEGPNSGESDLDDMLAIALHCWDLVDAIRDGSGVPNVHLVGHDVGAMIVAEMAALARHDVSRIALLSPLGLWSDTAPIADIFSMLPFEFPAALFSDVAKGTELLTGGLDFEDPKAIETFQVRNSRRLGFVGKMMFPIPNRRFSTRAYRVAAPTTVLWGANDKLTPLDPYLGLWDSAIPDATSAVIGDAGHCVHLEQPIVCAQMINDFLAH
jgi:pimeloyl-ACP methyl ester carboxylesterase